MKSIDKAIRALDEAIMDREGIFVGYVIKKANGYELGVNPNHELYIAFP